MSHRWEEMRLSPLIEACLSGDRPEGGERSGLLERFIDAAVAEEATGAVLIEACGLLIAELGLTLTRVEGNEEAEQSLREGSIEGASRLLSFMAVHTQGPEGLMWLGAALMQIGRAEEER